MSVIADEDSFIRFRCDTAPGCDCAMAECCRPHLDAMVKRIRLAEAVAEAILHERGGTALFYESTSTLGQAIAAYRASKVKP